jgi:oligopeptide/dipeptide ABC transporter ATP-binding protein
MNQILLDVVGLKTQFKTIRGVVRAVDGMNLRMGPKETLGLVGESGCGKSMTAFSIMGLVPPPGRIVDGKILLNGRNLLELSEEDKRRIRGKEISMVFQNPLSYLNPVFKVGDQVAESILLNQDVSKKEAWGIAVESMGLTGIPTPESIAQFYPHQLSGGMRQRVLIAMALSSRPSLLIADEPTSALDVTVQAQIMDVMKELKDEMGLSILMITHDMGLVADICDRASVMYAGKVMESSDIYPLFEDPKHPYTKGLLDSVLSTKYKRKLSTIMGVVPDLTKIPPGCRFHPRCNCKKPICSQKEPPIVEVEKGHTVSCWLYAEEQ